MGTVTTHPFDPTAWPAPAKLNRMLHIVGRRADGYHLLQTAFQFLNYGDDLWFEIRADSIIHHENPLPDLPAHLDLTIRAAKLLQQVTGTSQGARMRIAKKIPFGGGLGGGSSNAATTLIALNHLWKTGLSLNDLAAVGVQLGADVPVFVHGRAAWAEGIGEKLTPVDWDEPWFVVLIPAVEVATGRIFHDQELTRNSSPITIGDFTAGAGGNDCESVVYRRYPEVAAAATWLAQYGIARLTGTGACVFAAFADKSSAAAVCDKLPAGWRGLMAKGYNQSPLHAHWARQQIM